MRFALLAFQRISRFCIYANHVKNPNTWYCKPCFLITFTVYLYFLPCNPASMSFSALRSATVIVGEGILQRRITSLSQQV